MRPIVLLAQSKDLHAYVKTVEDLDLKSLLEIHKRLLKIHQELAENLARIE